MSYRVLARRCRPQNFKQVIGQDHVVKALTYAILRQQLPHAYLFSGTRGVGKTSVARIFAKSINCSVGITTTPCEKCSCCQSINEGRFVDLLEIDAASRTKVEDTRDILDNVQYQPVQGRFKVYLIDEIHMLSKHSFNALLKTLEEPPKYVKFLLVTTDPQKLPITILSRCVQFHLKIINDRQLIKQLNDIFIKENINFDIKSLQLIAQAAHGSMRDALSLAEQALAYGQGQLQHEQVRALLGTIDPKKITQIVQKILARDANGTMALVHELAELSPDYPAIYHGLLNYFHQLARKQLLAGSKASYQSALEQSLAPELVQLYYQIVTNGYQELSYMPDLRIALEMTMLRLLAFTPVAQITKPPTMNKEFIEKTNNHSPNATIDPKESKPTLDLVQVSSASNNQKSRHQEESVTQKYELNQLLDSRNQLRERRLTCGKLAADQIYFDNADVKLNINKHQGTQGRALTRAQNSLSQDPIVTKLQKKFNAILELHTVADRLSAENKK